MNKKFENIIAEGKKNGKTIEEINELLKAAGANFHLNPDGGVDGWTEAEMAEGFRPGEPAQVVQREIDMSRREDLAGTTQRQKTSGGFYEVTYDELGYAGKAVKVK